MESFDVGAGDYILCFSDGVSGNLALNEIARLVSACEGQSAEVVARTIVAAAQNAKIIADDVTAVAVRVGEGGWVGGATDSDAASGDGQQGLVESKVSQHGQSAPLGSAPARLLRLLRARLVALGSSALPGRARPTERPATALGSRASRLQRRRFHHLLTIQVQVRLQKPLGIVLEELQSGGAGVEVDEP